MGLVHIEGVNCFYNSIINVAKILDIDYYSAFSTLWSEIDLNFNGENNYHTSKNLIINLEAMGLKLDKYNCLDKNLSDIFFNKLQLKSYYVLGADAYYLPWTPFFNKEHMPHFFFAYVCDKNNFNCGDSHFNVEMHKVSVKDISPYIFEAYHLYKCKTVFQQFSNEPLQEARCIIKNNAVLKNTIYIKASEFNIISEIECDKLSKYIVGLIHNRILYSHYILQKYPKYKNQIDFLNSILIAKWHAVKYGFYKSNVMNDYKFVEQSLKVLDDILDTEIQMATSVIDI